MSEYIWRVIAWSLTHPRMFAWLLRHSRVTRRTPHLEGYMLRYTLVPFNRWVPHIRLHCILRGDSDKALHDHPGDYRTIILRGGYDVVDIQGRQHSTVPGDTRYARAEEFHRISYVTRSEPTWTLFILYKKRQTWGFLVNDAITGVPRKIPYYTYLGIKKPA